MLTCNNCIATYPVKEIILEYTGIYIYRYIYIPVYYYMSAHIYIYVYVLTYNNSSVLCRIELIRVTTSWNRYHTMMCRAIAVFLLKVQGVEGHHAEYFCNKSNNHRHAGKELRVCVYVEWHTPVCFFNLPIPFQLAWLIAFTIKDC